MSEQRAEASQRQGDRPGERPGYDIVAAQERWRAVWEELDRFRAADDGSR